MANSYARWILLPDVLPFRRLMVRSERVTTWCLFGLKSIQALIAIFAILIHLKVFQKSGIQVIQHTVYLQTSVSYRFKHRRYPPQGLNAGLDVQLRKVSRFVLALDNT